MGRKPRRRKGNESTVQEEPKNMFYQSILPAKVKDILDVYSDLWKTRYGNPPRITGRERSKMADVVQQIQDVVVVKRALRFYMKDSFPGKKCGHSLAWFLATLNEWMVKSSSRGDDDGEKKIAKRGGEDFENEVRRFKDEKGKRIGKARSGDAIRKGHGRRRRQR